MRLFSLAAFALAVCLGGVAVAADDKANEADLKAMVGKWKVQKAELGGNDITEMTKTLTLELMPGGKWKMAYGDELATGTVSLDASKKPRELDVKSETGPQKGMTMKGIYKLDGDTMTVCYDAGGTTRPKAFESKEATQLLIVYKREKK
jgi:uncharacterized protein (TIGR03067 family)